ncbi:hypothetical protein GRI33_07700 [Brucella sp. BO3]|uniref:hypothetical protein n=1 Tax=unclassified Brucella TaxID=2632610 RepID=UPI00114CEC87|nr:MULTISPECIES: hypothetical protein [unclassified Brucella]QMV26810.1 hypothetical protein GRI33_07700 [Brucella sp. BO3]
MDISSLIEIVKDGGGATDTVFKALKTAKEVFKKPQPLTKADIVPVENGLLEAMDQILQLKQMQLELIDALIALKQQQLSLDEERIRIKQFEADAKNYVLKEVSPHSRAYVPTAAVASGESPQYLCVSCFEQKQRSLLQFEERDFHFDTLQCPQCSGTIRVPNDVRMEVRTVRVPNKFDGFI